MTKYYSMGIVFYNAVTSAIRLSRSETPDFFTRSREDRGRTAAAAQKRTDRLSPPPNPSPPLPPVA